MLQIIASKCFWVNFHLVEKKIYLLKEKKVLILSFYLHTQEISFDIWIIPGIKEKFIKLLMKHLMGWKINVKIQEKRDVIYVYLVEQKFQLSEKLWVNFRFSRTSNHTHLTWQYELKRTHSEAFSKCKLKTTQTTHFWQQLSNHSVDLKVELSIFIIHLILFLMEKLQNSVLHTNTYHYYKKK